MTPLQVRYYSYKPVAGAMLPHLDGVLASAVCQSLQVGWVQTGHDEVLFLPVPLAVHLWIDNLPMWATNSFSSKYSEVRRTRYCQKSGDNPLTLPAQINTLSHKKPERQPSKIEGQYQHCLIPMKTEMADYWRATCLGNYDEVMQLLSAVTAFGRKRKVGWGAIAKWEVTPIQEFKVTRPAPSNSGEGVFGSWTNPHWDDRLWRYCT